MAVTTVLGGAQGDAQGEVEILESSVLESRDAAWLRAQSDPETFWREAADAIDWSEQQDSILGANLAQPDWFKGWRLNTCYNALDRHVDSGRGDQDALIFHSQMTSSSRRFSFRQLRDEVAKVAAGLVRLGVERGDRVVIYMPMIPEAVFAMLACARIGAIHSVVFGGFAGPELAKRIEHAQAKVLLTASCGLEPGRIVNYLPLVEEALADLSFTPQVVVLSRDGAPWQAAPENNVANGWVEWREFVHGAGFVECVEVDAQDPLYILYTSGTTGSPKGVVRDNGGHAVALCWSMRYVYNVKPGDVFWAASDIGWVVGHSYIVYGPLLAGCTTLLYEGKPVGTPDASVFWQVMNAYAVNVFFTAPTAIRAIRREDPDAQLVHPDLGNSLRAVFLAGERSDPATLDWVGEHLKVPVIDHWWQTELGWPALGRCLGLNEPAATNGSAGRPIPGFDVVAVDEQGGAQPASTEGDLVIRLPLPPGASQQLWGEAKKFTQAYLQNYANSYATGDAGLVNPDGSVNVMGRTDDVINVAGHRLSTGAMEEVVSAHKDVAECAVVGVPDDLKGQVPVALVVVRQNLSDTQGHEFEAELAAQIVQAVRHEIGAVAALKRVELVSALPKTRSGKILRKTVRAIFDGTFNPHVDTAPSTIEDPSVLYALHTQLTPPDSSPE